MDKTHVTRQGNIKVWPAYVTINNCTTQKINSLKGARLIGYCPIVPYSKNELKIFLNQAGCPNYQKETMKMLNKYFETKFLTALIAPIVEHQQSKTILLMAVGCANSLRKALFVCHMMSFTCNS
jgi:hypothetical protein